MTELPAAILDIDGTLVDSNYQHALTWRLAFARHGVELETWRIHRSIGMGGDQMIPALAGEDVEKEKGDDIRASESALYLSLFINLVQPFPDAKDFISFLVDKGHKVILSSSAKDVEVEHYIDILEAKNLVEGWTTSDDVSETKPEPDVIKAALGKLGMGGREHPSAVMIGDSVFDVEAAARAEVPTIALRTGGFGADELTELGAKGVYASLTELREEYGKTPLTG